MIHRGLLHENALGHIFSEIQIDKTEEKPWQIQIIRILQIMDWSLRMKTVWDVTSVFMFAVA